MPAFIQALGSWHLTFYVSVQINAHTYIPSLPSPVLRTEPPPRMVPAAEIGIPCVSSSSIDQVRISIHYDAQDLQT